MVYDCFPFFNELDILSLRLNILDKYVDYFVISESSLTFSGEKKPLFYLDNKHLFEKFQKKIIHNIVEPGNILLNPFERDVYQKDSVKNALLNCNDNDVIIFSDLDEIPNPKRIEEIFENFDNQAIYHMAQRNFYFYLNLEEISGSLLSYTGEFDNVLQKKWLGTKVCSFRILRNLPISQLRWPEMKVNGIRVDNGGWHFTYMGGSKDENLINRVEYKIKSAAHQEFNNSKIINNIKKKIVNKKDIFGRDSSFKVVDIDESFPEYLLLNLDSFQHLLLNERDSRKGFFWPKLW
jgi:beta-1,4-mannosyl-glycoprotein beta-1,4-N-acetylglucosaminyltransferase